MEPQVLSGVVTEPGDLMVNVGRVSFAGTDATAIPSGVTDWTYFRGALLVILVRDADGAVANGTAFMIAPGLALTATHTVDDHTRGWQSGDVELICVGPTPNCLVLWRVTSILAAEGDDIAYLSLRLISEPEASPMGIRLFALTTRAPAVAERVHIFGFRFNALHGTGGEINMSGDLYAAAGVVQAIHHPHRDAVLMPYPTIEVACGALGAMSGGPVVDDAGFVVGIVSRAFETAEGDGPTSAPWVIGGLDREVAIDWPSEMYPDPVSVLGIEDDLLKIEGRDSLRRTDSGEIAYSPWSLR